MHLLVDLDLMKHGQDLTDVASSVLMSMKDVLKQTQPDLLLVHGDTTTALASAMAAFYLSVPVGHVEAGLRTFDLQRPFPEEFNRQVIAKIAAIHFAPTQLCKENLLKEGIESSSVHVNPNVQAPVSKLLGGLPNLHLIPPQDYLQFICLLESCLFVLTDSGGIQEEAPSLGKPVLVMRETTERPEAVTAGTVELVGASAERIVSFASKLFENVDLYKKMSSAHNPYGDGLAVPRIVAALLTE